MSFFQKSIRSDEDLLTSLRQGSEDAFTVIYERYHKLLYVLAYKYLKSTYSSEDAVQQVFLKLWEARSLLMVNVNLRNYLYTMLKNHVLNEIRNNNSAVEKNYEIVQSAPEYVMEIISAEGRQGAALAKSALDGALAQRIAGIQAALQTLAAHLTAWIDYPEEDVPEVSQAELIATLSEQKNTLDQLIAGYGAGAVLRRGVDCVLLGRPNVGKSTLLNLLAGFDRAIVTPIAGTTRDVLEQAVMLGDTGIRLNLFDTAGVRDVGEHGDAVEAEGIRRSWKKLEEAGLVLAVFDLAAPLNEEDLEIARRCQGRPALAILNKQDLAGQGEAFTAAQQQLVPYFKAIIPLTARDAASLQPLCQAVAQLLGTANLDPNAAALCSARQLSAAKEARDALAEALNSQEDGFGLDAAGVCISDAQRALARLTGEDATEATIDEVFSTFCVGK